jgi:hypothetical protein
MRTVWVAPGKLAWKDSCAGDDICSPDIRYSTMRRS